MTLPKRQSTFAIVNANDQLANVLMIERWEGVEHIVEILSVGGVAAVLIGPCDLSGSYGVVGQLNH